MKVLLILASKIFRAFVRRNEVPLSENGQLEMRSDKEGRAQRGGNVAKARRGNHGDDSMVFGTADSDCEMGVYIP